MEPQKETIRAWNKAKIHLMQQPNSTFISTLLFGMRTIWTDSPQMPTAGTDGISLWLNEKYFMGLTPPQRIGLLFHEAWHKAWNHMQRGKDLDPRNYNIAGDHVINLMALDVGYELPPKGHHDKKYKGMSTLEVYNLLPPPPPPKEGTSQPCIGGIGASGEGVPNMDPNNPGGDIIYDTDSTPEEKQVELAGELLKAVTAAKMQGDNPGSIPGEIQIMLDEMFDPKLPWQTLLQNYMTAFAKEDYTWTRPNRRYMPEFYLPSAHSEAVGHLAIAVDTSGSVTDNEFVRFISEIKYIQESLMPEKITVIDFDTSIKKVHTMSTDESVADIKFSGRGGTDVHPVMDWAEKNDPLVMIVFSDMEFSYPTEDPGCPVLWIVVNNPGAPEHNFGTSIHLETDR